MRVAVVGAGPAGLAFASSLGDAEVFEEHWEVGLPRHCTSLVSSEGASRAGISPRLVLASYGHLTIADLAGRRIYFRLRRPVYLIDRPGLERDLAGRVGRIELGVRVRGLRGRYLVTDRGPRGPYDLVVLAEGAARRLSGRFGHVVRMPGLQVDVKSPVGLEGITVLYDRRLSEAYFAWVVEVDRGLYRVGLADRCCTVERLRKLVKLLRGTPVDRPFGGGVLAGPPLRRLVHGPVVLVGDAGGLVKPLSGGGIVLSMVSGRTAAEAAARWEPERYDWAMWPLKARLRAAFHAFRVMYGMRFVDRLLDLLDGGEYVAVDYDDHLRTLAAAALTDARSVRALGELGAYLARLIW